MNMRPMLKTAMRRSWRNRESVQFGVDPAHAVVLDSVDGAAAGFLDLLDGTRGLGPLSREARPWDSNHGRRTGCSGCSPKAAFSTTPRRTPSWPGR
jgi:hypothetical protein